MFKKIKGSFLRYAAALMLSISVITPSIASAEVPTPERLMMDLQRDFDLSPVGAASFTGNFAHESANFTAQEEYEENRHGTKGYGFAMWTNGRRDALEAYARNNGLDVNSYEAQYGHLREELSGPYSSIVNRVRNASSIEEATRIVMDDFESPAEEFAYYERRLAYANGHLNGDYSGAGALSSSGGSFGGAVAIEPAINVVLMPWT